MEFILYVLELIMTILGLLRSLFYKDGDVAAAGPVQGQTIPEHPVPSKPTFRHPVADEHAVFDQLAIPDQSQAQLAIQKVAEELPQSVSFSSLIQTPAPQHLAGLITLENSPLDPLKEEHLKAQ